MKYKGFAALSAATLAVAPAATASIVLAPAASAADYASAPHLAVWDPVKCTVNADGKGITIDGDGGGFAPNSDVTVTVLNSKGEAVKDNNGAAAKQSVKAGSDTNYKYDFKDVNRTQFPKGQYTVTSSGHTADGKAASVDAHFTVDENCDAHNNGNTPGNGTGGNTSGTGTKNAGTTARPAANNGTGTTWGAGNTGTAARPAGTNTAKSPLAYTGASDKMGIVLASGAVVALAGVTTVTVARRRKNNEA